MHLKSQEGDKNIPVTCHEYFGLKLSPESRKEKRSKSFSLVVKILAIESMVPPHFHVSVDKNIAETTVSLLTYIQTKRSQTPHDVDQMLSWLTEENTSICPQLMR